MAYKQKQSSCAKMVDAKGKPSGLMMAGSAYHMESTSQEKKNLVNDMPIDSKSSAMEMSPYKMGHGSPAKETDPNSKDGVTVTGDASKIGGKTTKTEKEKRLEEVKKKVEAKRIKLANEREAKKLEVETRRANAGKKVIQNQQQRRKEQGKDYIDPAGNVVRRS